MFDNMAKPPNTAPVAPRLVSATGRAQQDDATKAPKPVSVPSPANQLPVGVGSRSIEGAMVTGRATADGVSVIIVPLCIP